MFCYKCGAELEDGAMFCWQCGEKCDTSVNNDNVSKNSDSEVTVLESNSSSMENVITVKRCFPKILFVVIAVTILIGGIITAIVLLDIPKKVKLRQQMDLGSNYLSELQYEEAIVAFEAVIEIEPNEVGAYIGLADAYVGKGDYEKAMNILAEGIAITEAEELYEYRDVVQEKWNDAERCVSGCIYAVDTDLDNSNNIGIDGAYISVTDSKGENKIYYADANGFFETDNLEKGKYTLYFYADGYIGCNQIVELDAGRYENNVYLEPETYATLYGNVQIADIDINYSNNYPLENAEVTLTKLTGSNAFQTVSKTDANGQYHIADLVMGVYELTIVKNGYITANQTVIIYEGQETSYNTIIELVDDEWIGNGSASGMIYDAVTGYGVSDLRLNIRSGIDNRDGVVVATCETDENGKYQTPELPSGNYCVEVMDRRLIGEDSYLKSYINIKILGGINIANQDGTVSTTLLNGQVRIVLSWGVTPRDLDSHLYCTLDSGDYCHIYYSNQTFYLESERIADLDLDDTSSYGPETTTIYNPMDGEYAFAVYNYSRGSDSELAYSGACVQVYMDYSSVPSYIFYVPNEYGYWWNVFTYNSLTGVLTPINEIVY